MSLHSLLGQLRKGHLLGKDIDVVRVFHLRHHGHDCRVRNGQPKTESGHSPGLGKGLEHHQIGVCGYHRHQRRGRGEVDVGLVHDHDAPERAQERFNLLFREYVAGRIVRGTDEHQGSLPVTGRKHRFRVHREVLPEHHRPEFDVIGGSGNRVHSVARGDRHRIRLARNAEHPEEQVDGLIASVADEQTLGRNLPDCGDSRLQSLLMWVRIPVETIVVGALVGVQEYLGTLVPAVIAGCRICFQSSYVGPDQADHFFNCHCSVFYFRFPNLILTAEAWASRPSASAILMIVSPMAFRPSSESS